MFWLKTNATGLLADQHVIQKWAVDDSAVGWMTRVRGADDNFAAMVGSSFNGGAGAYVQSPATILADTWVHLALTFDGTWINIYQDGVLVNSVDPATDYTPADIVTPFVMGYRSNNTSSFVNGVLDEVRIYDYALSQADIISISGATAPTICISAALETDFDQNCVVDTDDLTYMAGVWLTADALADLAPVIVDGPDGDGVVNLQDLGLLAHQWLECVDHPANCP